MSNKLKGTLLIVASGGVGGALLIQSVVEGRLFETVALVMLIVALPMGRKYAADEMIDEMRSLWDADKEKGKER